MLKRVLAAAAAVVMTGAQASAQPDGYELVYSEPTPANLGGRPVVADIDLYVDPAALEAGEISLALVTDVTKFIDETERDLENWVAAHQDRCGQRWKAGEPEIDFPPKLIRFALYIELEVWNCGLRGQGEPRRFARETGKADVTIQPYVMDGELQARMITFTVTEQAGLSRFLPLEYVASQVIDDEMEKLNENIKFTAPPQPLYGAGYVYEDLKGEISDDGRFVITAMYRGEGSRAELDALLDDLRGEGLHQDGKPRNE